MPSKYHRKWTGACAFLTTLARDTRANALAIMAMALIPLAGMVGGGVDISRMYIVKTRLQHACDAGALAGRKAMGAGVWSYNNFASRRVAERFFDANINATPYGASNLQRTFVEDSGKVVGTASATLPMTLMRIFGTETQTLSVTCDAEMRLPNTDIMFVLDVTGSMASKAVNSDPDTKIESLRTAVKCFYEIVARLDTNAVCTHGQPTGGTGDQVQIRFGFVPYNTNVNVGRLLSPDWFANQWAYQSREPVVTTNTSTEWVPNPSTTAPSGNETRWGDWFDYGSPQYFSCPSYSPPGWANTTYTTPTTTSGNTRYYDVRTITGNVVDFDRVEQRSGPFNIVCQLRVRLKIQGTYTGVRHSETLKTTATSTFQRWRYAQITHNIRGLKDANDIHKWNSSGTVDLPIGNEGAMVPVRWDGCIEERATVRASSYSPIPANAHDLNIDLVPDQNAAGTLWGPALPDVIFTRQATSSNSGNTSGWNTAEVNTTTNYRNNSNYFCPTEGRLMQVWNNPITFENYVDGLQPNGNTYHDIGLIWGARLISPTGLFAGSNAHTPSGGDIERHIIFMTDGDTVTNATDYAAYGLPWFDRRQTNANSVPSSTDLNNQVNARFSALCTAVKNKNITLWVISFGSGSNSSTEQRLENCASSDRYFVARDSATLQQTFRSIADQISQLRLTK